MMLMLVKENKVKIKCLGNFCISRIKRPRDPNKKIKLSTTTNIKEVLTFAWHLIEAFGGFKDERNWLSWCG